MATKKPVTKKTEVKSLSFKDMTIKELQAAAITLQNEAVELKRGTKVGDVQNVHAYSVKRKEVARVLTALNAKKASGEEK